MTERGTSKDGANVGRANIVAIDEYDVPVANIDFCCSDTTASNSSLNLPKEKGGTGGKGGAYAHIWAWFKSKGHVLFFMLWCLSHCVNNEVAAVMKSAGACPPGQGRLRKKAKLGSTEAPLAVQADDEQGGEEDEGQAEGGKKIKKKPDRWLLVEHLNDVVYAVQTTDGCREYVRDIEGLAKLAQATYGVDTRWGYYICIVVWLQLTTRRYEIIMTYLLHCWLKAEGHAGVTLTPHLSPHTCTFSPLTSHLSPLASRLSPLASRLLPLATLADSLLSSLTLPIALL